MATATAQEVIERAARRINVLAAEEALSANEMTDCLQIMNDMMFNFTAKGIQYVHVQLAQSDTVNVPDEQVRNVILMLCDDLADDFGMPVSVDMREDIRQARQELQNCYMVINPAVPDKAVRSRRLGYYNWRSGA